VRSASRLYTQVHIEAAFGTLRKQSVTSSLAWSDFQFVRELGKGSFGLVGLYKWRPGAMKRLEDGTLVPREGTVAVKSLLPAASASADAVSDFVTEVAILEKLSHSCIVGCLGTGTHPDPKARAEVVGAFQTSSLTLTHLTHLSLCIHHRRGTICCLWLWRRSRAATCAARFWRL